MQVLVAPTEPVVLGEKTFFSADEAASQTILSVDNPSNIAQNDYVILGLLHSETAEICKISSTSTNTITVATATIFEHLKDVPIQVIRYNQRKFYRSSTQTGTFTH